MKTTVAYSKSTRVNHIDVRGKVDGEANTISCGDGGSNQSTCNYVVEQIDNEEWNPIEGFEGYYEVSNLGKVRSLSRNYVNARGDKRVHKGKVLIPQTHKSGYLQVDLNKDGISTKGVKVHRLVASAFIPNPETKPEVNHRNGIKSDNRVTNLEWNTRIENMKHASDSELMVGSNGEDNGNAKLTEGQVLEICRLIDSGEALKKDIAEIYGVSTATIGQINSGVTWNYLTKRSQETGDGGSNMSTQNFVAVHYGFKNKEHEYKEVSPTLKAQSHGHEPMAVEIDEPQNVRIRKLTPIECERLQGYPDNHTRFGRKEDGTVYEMSNSQRYKQCGNGVSSPVAATILQAMIPGDEHVRVQSLFSGILGTELNLPERFKLTGTCEFDKYASDVIRFHKPEVPNFHDVTKFIERTDVPDFDLLTFGFPCQSFSIAGLRQGFEDEKGRGQMIYHCFDILKKHNPKYFLAENVRGLLNHDKGKTIIEILKGLSEVGYEIDFEEVNSKHYGLAQNRQRVFIFGRLK